LSGAISEFNKAITAKLPADFAPLLLLHARDRITWPHFSVSYAMYRKSWPITIAATVAAFSCRSCLIDGEVVICGEDGVPVFDRLRYGRRPQVEAMLFVFDLIELAGKDLRRAPVEERKRLLAKLLRTSSWALQLNEHIVESGDIVFRHACKLGFEGIVSKRLGSPYISGRSHHWIKMKNPMAPAVKREAEEDWGKERWR
jgi:bifunctional non-homologous end joining protein LigD